MGSGGGFLLDRLVSALKSPVNEAVNHWIDRSGIVGIFSSIGLAANKAIDEAEQAAADLIEEAQELEQTLEQAGDLVDYAAILSMIAVILLIVSHLFRIWCSHLDAKLKQIQIQQAKNGD